MPPASPTPDRLLLEAARAGDASALENALRQVWPPGAIEKDVRAEAVMCAAQMSATWARQVHEACVQWRRPLSGELADALCLACSRGLGDAVDHLLNLGVNPHHNDDEPFVTLAANGHVELARRYLDRFATTMGLNGRVSAVQWVAECGDEDRLNTLAQHYRGQGPDWVFQESLVFLAMHGHTELAIKTLDRWPPPPDTEDARQSLMNTLREAANSHQHALVAAVAPRLGVFELSLVTASLLKISGECTFVAWEDQIDWLRVYEQVSSLSLLNRAVARAPQSLIETWASQPWANELPALVERLEAQDRHERAATDHVPLPRRRRERP